MGESNLSSKRKFDFSIDAILNIKYNKRQKKDVYVKTEPDSSPVPVTSSTVSCFPQWTQCQRDVKKSRRPYSRPTVTALSWWFHHLPFLTVEEMEVVGGLTSLTRHQVKVWWQNRRHSQRGRSEQADRKVPGLTSTDLPRPQRHQYREDITAFKTNYSAGYCYGKLHI